MIETDINKYEWSAGIGQCPCCYGKKPDIGWWTDTIGHDKDCALAGVMGKAGLDILWECENPYRRSPDSNKGHRGIESDFDDVIKEMVKDIYDGDGTLKG